MVDQPRRDNAKIRNDLEPLKVALLGQSIDAPEISLIVDFLRPHIEKSYHSQIQPALTHLKGNSLNAQWGPFEDTLDLIREVAIILRERESAELSLDHIIDSLIQKSDVSGRSPARNVSDNFHNDPSSTISQVSNPDGDVRSSATILDSANRDSLRQAVFSCIGYITLLYLPKQNITGTNLAIDIQIQSTRRVPSTSVSAAQASRRLQGLLKNFGELFPEVINSTDDKSTIYRSRLSYFTLHRLSNVNINWVDVLSMHLEFNSSTKELALFRFPSFCLFHSRRASGKNSFHCALTGFNSMDLPGDMSTKASQSFLNEVILSYRLLFGHDRRSRRIFRALELSRASKDGLRDPLLMSLCGKKRFKITRYDVPWSLSPRSFYSVQEDFPLLGSRLLQIQEFSMRQDSSTLREFWADRRNPFNFWTFWAVIIVGAISILLSIIQCGLSIAQVVIAANQG